MLVCVVGKVENTINELLANGMLLQTQEDQLLNVQTKLRTPEAAAIEQKMTRGDRDPDQKITTTFLHLRIFYPFTFFFWVALLNR